jgi:predicted nuclease of predicted toxin-antitoxin system
MLLTSTCSLTASDAVILGQAEADGYVLVTADTDFPMLVALRRTSSPSVVLLRGVAELPVDRHLELLVTNLPAVINDLERGAIVTISPARVRVRDLPMG